MNLWILTGLRSGSTLLWKLLWDTKLFSYPDKHSDHPSLDLQRSVGEFLAPNHNIDPWDVLQVPKTREMTIQYLKMKSKLAGTENNVMKLPIEQYHYYLLDHNDRPLIQSLFPDSRFIWLEREDIYARTVSAYIFFTTRTAHLQNQKQKDEWLKKPVPWNSQGILDVYYNHIKKCDWGSFLEGENYLKVSYEELVADPALTLKKCMDWAGVDGRQRLDYKGIADRQPKFKTERPETQEYIKKLKRLLIGMI